MLLFIGVYVACSIVAFAFSEDVPDKTFGKKQLHKLFIWLFTEKELKT